MKLMGNSHMELGFLWWAILLFHIEVRADTTTALLTTTETPTVPTTQTPTHTSGALTTLPLGETSTYTTQISTFESTSTTQPTTFSWTSTSQSSSETSTAPQMPSTLAPEVPPSPYTVTGTDQELATPSQDQMKAELCEENSKRLILICLIIIGVLIFICVCLLVATVAMANKISYMKKRQPSKRPLRSNGDFLTTNSLWPAGLETLQRMTNEAAAAEMMAQRTGSERTKAGQGKTGEEASKKLASELSDRQKLKEVSAKPASSTTTII
uniref:protein EVI2A n=1 Tax=Podarcis muralis TaxID=64176 RepID=UPI0010A01BA0|nr:protein EVI2A [Podarcis muralis]